MSNKHYINAQSMQLVLDSVKYSKIKATVQKKQRTVRPEVQDTFSVKELRERDINIHFTRSVFFKPKAVMYVDVGMSIYFAIDRADREEVMDESILGELEERVDELLVAAASNASLLISSLLSVSFTYPLITPPYFIRDTG